VKKSTKCKNSSWDESGSVASHEKECKHQIFFVNFTSHLTNDLEDEIGSIFNFLLLRKKITDPSTQVSYLDPTFHYKRL
jgi:hypothetical protein